MRIAVTAAAICLSIVGLSVAEDAGAAMKKQFTDIPAQGLGPALQTLAQQREFQVVYLSDDVDSLRTVGAVGEMTSDEALTQLLIGTGLTFRYLEDNTVTILPLTSSASAGGDQASGTGEGGTTQWGVRVAQNGPEQNNQSSQNSAASSQSEKDPSETSSKGSSDSEEKLEEVVVTGTHIRGGVTASPVLVFTQNDFARVGASTAQQFLSMLPQNVNAQADDTTHEAVTLHEFNPTYGSGVNLRGLGSSSTLVLIDGRRTAAAGVAEYTDVSMIPLSAVERIEIMTDGASAIYGSDAVGGVVNFIMRKNFSGAETQLRGGGTTQGGASELLASQSFGKAWNSGSAMLNYQYYRRDSLPSGKRSFSDDAVAPLDLLPYQQTDGVYLNSSQRISSRATLGFDAMYTQRDTHYVDYDLFALELTQNRSESQQYGASLGADIELQGSWQLNINGTGSRNESELTIESPTDFGGFGSFEFDSESELLTADAIARGDVGRLPAGTVRLATGVGYREDEFALSQAQGDFVITPLSAERSSVKSVFAELYVPLLSMSKTAESTARLDLTIAGRYEDHDAFGGTFDPKFGIRWLASESLQFRATYGTSFKAPSSYQLNEFNGSVGIADRPDVQSPTGVTRAINFGGNNAGLQPQEATIWTAGLTFIPTGRSIRTELTYFDIDYDDRISFTGQGSTTLLNDPLFESLVIRRDELSTDEFNALVAEALAGSLVIIGCPVPLTPTGACTEPVGNFDAIINNRALNLAEVRTSGVDLTYVQSVVGLNGTVTFDLNASYIFDYELRVIGSMPLAELADTSGYPVDFQFQAGASWNRGPWDISLRVTHADAYQSIVPEVIDIGSWTSFDLGLQYDFGALQRDGLFKNTVLSFNVRNLFDQDPPSFFSPDLQLGYDPSGFADPQGRILIATIRKQW